MSGLINLYGVNDINTSGNIHSNSYELSNALYFTGLSGNIQEQINRLMNYNYINIITISGSYSNVTNTVVNNYNTQNSINNNIYGSISGAVFNISNIINNNQIYNNNINNYLTYYINSISGTILTINNNLNNTINNNVTNQNTINNNLYGSISGSLISINNTINSNITNQSLINNNLYYSILGLSGLIYNIPPARQGIQGIQGIQGDRGDTGARGEKGNTGGGVASGGSIGAIINGAASLGLGAAIAIIASSLTAGIALVQAQIVSLIAQLGFANVKIWGLQTATIAMQTEIKALIAQSVIQDGLIAELQAKTALLDGNIFTGTLRIFGSIEQTLGFEPNVFFSDVAIRSNLIVYGGIQSGRDLIIFE